MDDFTDSGFYDQPFAELDVVRIAASQLKCQEQLKEDASLPPQEIVLVSET